MTDLLLEEFPPLPPGSETPLAIVLRSNYEYDDAAGHVPPALQNHVPGSMKKNGKLSLYENEEGFLYSRSPTGGWGVALFIRDGLHLHVVLPVSYMLIGKAFRPLLDKQRDQQPLVVNTTSGSSAQPGSTRFKRYLRTFWNCARHDVSTLKPLGLSNERCSELFSDANFTNNINTITSGLVPEAKRILEDGNFSLQDLLGLPDATTYSNSCQVIYLRIYLDLNGSGKVGLYIGQSHMVVKRMLDHERCTASTTREQHSCHYGIARQATDDNRHAVVLASWDNRHQISSSLLAMAEQTMISLFGCYHSWIASSNTTFTTEFLKTHNQYVYMQSVANEARNKVGWQRQLDVDTRGCNVTSPIFATAMTAIPIEVITMPTLDPKIRTFTTYRKEAPFRELNSRLLTFLIGARPDGREVATRFSFPKSSCRNFIPKRGYLVFEIMNDHGPHPKPWFGCPSVGPYENFDLVSCLGVRVEWLDEPSGQWFTVPLMAFGKTVATVEGLIKGWKQVVSIIQILEGITWTEPLHGFETISLGQREVRELCVNHLQQTCRWVPRQGQHMSPPTPASWGLNCQLMAKQFGHGFTVMGCDKPPHTDRYWATSTKDATWAGLNKINCDFCKYSKSYYPIPCERDPARTDIWVCKRCSSMNRPCTFTPRSISLELWGDEPPYLRQASGKLSQYPTGPHRKLAFHNPMPPAVLETPIPIREPFLFDSALVLELDIEEEEEEVVEAIGLLEGGEDGDF
ncbi:hypothetical protein FBULB1_1368 [Fusarium bulbicola]|nr:hypothetical protein FBULB1_1368 [Fusarium bulbicola]